MQQLSSRVATATRAKDMAAAGTTPCSRRREVQVTAEPSVASELSSQHGDNPPTVLPVMKSHPFTS